MKIFTINPLIRISSIHFTFLHHFHNLNYKDRIRNLYFHLLALDFITFIVNSPQAI